MSKAKKLIGAVALQASAMAMPLAVFAQSNIVPNEIQNNTDIVQIVRAVVRFILLIAFVLAFIFLLIGGLRWITAGGDEKSVAGARGMITAALIGLVIVLLAFAIIKLVETFFGVTIISGDLTIPTVSGS
ncbi:MAG: hypothetical protein UV59_C0043G0006 [Candidatus Gottesmanbacteria bacterium GW2011_GWA1_43_11]|uniref:Integral membrane protein n=1 Tax=Candidatus Gottesmanbacteria bacterium GW2011_GWA1_43_11 TaxID=1618436 RepID=A0A0G1EJW2_9BACT|nr:MAG: hypothetical protein UV59_C0043G0006 [Candidatus Gottesmanbacteria bacterium GW2011_GWA1_43_11]